MGIILCGATPDKIPERLAIFEKARRQRASAIQVLSNAGQEQVDIIHKEVEKYVGFVPSKSLSDTLMTEGNYG